MHRQPKPTSTPMRAPQSHELPKRPDFVSCPPPVHEKPRAICRNFVLGGACHDMACPRAHVPHNAMLDLFHYLLERPDCPVGLRYIRNRFTRPVPGKSRVERPSDRICPPFVNGYCIRQNNCTLAHLRPYQIYNSLWQPMLQPLKPFNPTTSVVVPILVVDRNPVVKLPQNTNTISQQSSVVDNRGVVPLPKITVPDCGSTSTQSDVLETRQCSAVDSLSEVTVRLPKSVAPQRENSPALAITQKHNLEDGRDSRDISEESSIESSDSVSSECTVADGPTPAMVSIPSKPFKQIVDPSLCLDWLNNRCFRPSSGYQHPRSQTRRDDILDSHNPLADQINVPLRDQKGSHRKPMSTCAPMTPIEHDPAVVFACTGNNSSHPIAQSPPHSQQKSVSVIHSARADSQGHLPPKLQERTQAPKCTPRDEFTHPVMDSTPVTFSDGFSIEKIVTAFQSLWFVVEDIPGTVSRAAIENLVSPFGKVQDVRFPEENQSDNSISKTVSVQMASYREVIRAINGLDGKNAFGRRIAVRLSLGKKIANRMLRDNYVRVRWPVPCKSGYAGYSTLEAAQKAVSKADGKIERGHWITARIYQSIPIIDAYNVRFTGLPPGVGQEFLDKFGPSEGTMLERPNYQAPEFGIPAVRKILANFGKITHFQVVPAPYKDGIVQAWCQFESPDVAAAACELHQIKQRSLNMEKISVRRVLSVLEHAPRARFRLVEQDLRSLQQKVWIHTHGAHLDIFPPSKGDDFGVRLVAEDSKTLARLRVELKEILDGEVLQENGQQVWDDFLRCEAGLHFMEQLHGSNPGVMISVHSVRRCIRLIGTVERRQTAAAAILAKLSSLRQHKVHNIPLHGQMMAVLASPDLAAAQQRYGEENIRVDFQERVLRVRGPDNLHEEMQQIIHTVKSRQVADYGDDYCPVCLEPILTPVSLGCGHGWCKACFVAYLTAAADTRSFPISCLGNQGRCTELVPMTMAREILPPADFDALALAAFHTYVQGRPGEYYYCPTPDCPQVYPTGPRNASLSCPSCLARICPSCHVEYHEGVTCADREDGGDRLFQEWMETHDVKKCPGCHAPIERAAGCNHMTCTRCHTHTCWVCLETFPQGQGIYDHMREFHGGIGL